MLKYFRFNNSQFLDNKTKSPIDDLNGTNNISPYFDIDKGLQILRSTEGILNEVPDYNDTVKISLKESPQTYNRKRKIYTKTVYSNLY